MSIMALKSYLHLVYSLRVHEGGWKYAADLGREQVNKSQRAMFILLA